MAKADYVFTAELDDSQIETTLNNIDERVEGLVGKFEGLGAAIEGLGSGSLQRLSQLGSPDAALLGFEELEGLLNRIIDKAREVEATAATSTTRGGQAQPSLPASLQPEPTGRAAQEAAVQEGIARANAALRRQQEEMRKAKEAAAKKQATLVALAAAELKLTARADDVTSSFIDQAAAGSRTLDAFEEVVSQTSRLSTANIELAKDTAEAKQRIREIGAELSKDNLDPEAAEALRAEVADIIETFNRENEARERRASLAREAVAAEERLRQEADLLGQAERNTAAAQEEFNQALRAFPDVQARLDAIAREQGEFSVALGRSSDELNEQQRAALDAINSNGRLADIVDRLTREYGQFEVQVRDTNAEVRETGDGLSALNFGAVNNAIRILTDAFRELARVAVQAFKDMVRESTQTAKEFEVVESAFRKVFFLEGTDTSEAVAGAMAEVRRIAEETGTNAEAIALRILPLVDSIDQVERAAKVIQGLELVDPTARPGQGLKSVAELLAGSGRSLEQAFELSADSALELQKELGNTEGALQGLEKILSDRGVNFDAQADTAAVLARRIEQIGVTFQSIVGQPILESLADSLGDIEEFIDDNRDDLELIAGQLGRTIAQGIESIANTLVELGEQETLGGIVDDLQNIEDSIVAIEALVGLLKEIESIAPPEENLLGEDFLNRTSLNPITRMTTAFGDLQTSIRGTITFIGELVKNFTAAAVSAEVIIDNIGALATGSKSLDEVLIENRDTISSAVEEAYRPFGDALDDLDGGLAENEQALEDQREAQKESEDQTAALAGAINTYKNSLDEITALEEENAELRAEIQEEFADLQEEVADRRLELEEELADRQIELEDELSAERTEILEDFADGVEDLAKERANKVADARLDEQRDLEDIEIDAQRKEEDILEESNEKRLDLEEDFRRRLEDIRRKFAFDAQEAIRQNDAIAFLRIRRRMQFELGKAREDRAREEEDIAKEEERALDELAKERRRDEEDAALSLERKLEDIDTFVARKFQKLLTGRDRDLADFRDKEIAKRAELEKWHDEQLEEIDDYEREKKESIRDDNKDTLQQIEDNLDAINDLTQKKLDALVEIWKSRSKEMAEVAEDIGKLPGNLDIPGDEEDPTEGLEDILPIAELREDLRDLIEDSDLPLSEKLSLYKEIETMSYDELLDLFNDLGGTIALARGGTFRAGQRLLVGEEGPEIVEFGVGGRVIPNDYLPSTGFIPNLSSTGSTTIDRSSTTNVDLSMLDPTSFSPTQLAKMRELVLYLIGQTA